MPTALNFIPREVSEVDYDLSTYSIAALFTYVGTCANHLASFLSG